MSTKFNAKKINRILRVFPLLYGLIWCLKSMTEGGLVEILLGISLAACGLVIILPVPHIVRVIGLCLFASAGAFAIGYYLTDFLLE